MANVLEKIVLDKKAEIAERKRTFPLEQFKHTLKPTEKDFYAALNEPNAGFIFECKKASPSKGLIREQFDLDEILDAYTPHASCISVLTDEKYFQGTFEYLDYVTQRVKQPVINKDFFVDPYQVYLARYHNADAILLMLSVLSDEEYTQLATLAKQYNLAVLTEVSNEEEVHRALALNANIIGINNRNLRDLSTDLATTERLVPLIKKGGFEGVIISESGIYTHQEVLRLAPHVQGFLVGSALMAERDLAQAVEKLVYGEVKVCGVTSLEQAKMISDFPVSYLGLIRVSASPRFIDDTTAAEIAENIGQRLVGVYQNAPIEDILNDASALNLSVIQLHGEEDQAFIKQLQEALKAKGLTVSIWKAFGIKTRADVINAAAVLPCVDKVLLDAKVGTQTGGTGTTFDWDWLVEFQDKSKLVLAGGLDAQNVNRARNSSAQVIDLNSGVESAKGIKDNGKLAEVFAKLRMY